MSRVPLDKEHDVMHCTVCHAYHFEQQGRCPECRARMQLQNGVSDRHYVKALRQEAERVLRYAAEKNKKLLAIAAAVEENWRERTIKGLPRFESEEE